MIQRQIKREIKIYINHTTLVTNKLLFIFAVILGEFNGIVILLLLHPLFIHLFFFWQFCSSMLKHRNNKQVRHHIEVNVSKETRSKRLGTFAREKCSQASDYDLLWWRKWHAVEEQHFLTHKRYNESIACFLLKRCFYGATIWWWCLHVGCQTRRTAILQMKKAKWRSWLHLQLTLISWAC